MVVPAESRFTSFGQLVEEELPEALGETQRFVVDPLATGASTTLEYDVANQLVRTRDTDTGQELQTFSFDDVGQGYDIAQMEDDRVAVTLGRHTSDYITSFYSWTPSNFMVDPVARNRWMSAPLAGVAATSAETWS